MNLFEYFEKQIDDLDLFSVLSNRSVFDHLKLNLPFAISPGNIIVPNKYDYPIYQQFYYKSIFLLGYSYYEGFIDDVIKSCQETNLELNQEIPFKYLQKIKRLNDLNLEFKDANKFSAKGNLIRNCFMHNKGLVSKKLSDSFPEYVTNTDVNISWDLLSEFRLEAISITKTLFNDAVTKYSIST